MVSFSPLSAMRPSAIIRSISRREATAGAGEQFGDALRPVLVPVAWQAQRAVCYAARGTGRLLVRCGGEVMNGVPMLFGKRKQVVKRILIVEDEPLTAFDNENMLGDAGYEVVATVDDLDEALESARTGRGAPNPQRRPPSRRPYGIELATAAKQKGIPDVVRNWPSLSRAPRKSPSAASQALQRPPAVQGDRMHRPASPGRKG